MKILSQSKIELAASGDIRTLMALDSAGLILGPGESAATFAARLARLKENMESLKADVRKQGELTIYGITLKASAEIPGKVFRAAQDRTQKLYGFAIDWVPGYFTNDRMGILFAGCAMYQPEDFFALFVIRRAFQKKETWWIYSRTELMTHELTHIGHIAFLTPNYEEFLAFQSSESRFRKLLGGIFCSPRDTYLALGGVFMVFIAQLLNIIFRSPDRVWDWPMPMVFIGGALPLAWITARYLRNLLRFRKARNRVAESFGDDLAMAVLFRCSESEIRDLASLASGGGKPWFAERRKSDLRWQVICSKFASDSVFPVEMPPVAT